MHDNGHMNARTLRARLDHPLVGADGRGLEDTPVIVKSDFFNGPVVEKAAAEVLRHGA